MPEHGPCRGALSWQVEGRMDSGGEKVDAGNSCGTLEILGSDEVEHTEKRAYKWKRFGRIWSLVTDFKVLSLGQYISGRVWRLALKNQCIWCFTH